MDSKYNTAVARRISNVSLLLTDCTVVLLYINTKCTFRLDSEYNTAASKRIGTVSLREMVHIPADDFKEVSVKINLTLQDSIKFNNNGKENLRNKKGQS